MAPKLNAREAPGVGSCALLLSRLKQVLVEETAALAAGGNVVLSAFVERKHQLLRDLLSAQRNFTSDSVRGVLAPAIAEVKLCLAENQRQLGLHIDAVRQVSAIIVDAMRQAESDGTYDRPAWRRNCGEC
ncbi:MAG: hypothetical protein HY245_05055 [Rhizobiales bacterium]|nr:hypothetical protein [Hyphomicrobiales bacterium]MBI3672782.1 hypothetical protein [Hyphomicrobiales bacterium]